jgi:hypothetical protein
MLNDISPSIKKTILICVMFFLISILDDFLLSLTKEMKSITLVGSIASVNTESKVSKRSPLPLALGIGRQGESDTNKVLNDSIFFDKQNTQTERPIVKKTQKTLKIVLDYQAIIDEKVIVTSISSNGAIINGRFYQTGHEIYDLNIFDSNGRALKTYLKDISSTFDSLTFLVGNTAYKVKV